MASPLKKIEANEDFSKKIVMSCCILHNFLRFSMKEIIENLCQINDKEPVVTLPISTSTSSADALNMRNVFSEWCVKEGDVAFQYAMITP